MRYRFVVLTFLLILILSSSVAFGTEKTAPTANGKNGNTVNLWMTVSDQSKLLEPQTPIRFTPADGSAGEYLIQVNENTVYQKMDGFGASFTDASAWLVYKKLTPQARQALMTKLFDNKEGIGLTFLRQPIGASDYNRTVYSYDDMADGQTDPALEHFSIQQDMECIIPILQLALKMNPSIKIMATPWSAPGWMKDNGSMIGKFEGLQGSLKKEYYDAYANYFVKFIQAYQTQGIPIFAITVQNEPGMTPSNYPGMAMNDKTQIDFIENHLGPLFISNKIKTKIFCYDYNWNNQYYVPNVLTADTGNYIAGSAWHFYGGTHSRMTQVHDQFPQKGVWFTEGSGGFWGAGSTWKGAFMDEMWHIIQIPRNWSRTVVWWNMALDQNNGPSLLAISTCRGIVTINQDSGEVNYNVDYYTMGHISKFVQPGAVRIDSNSYDNILENVAFKNPDGSKVLIVFNRTTDPKVFKVICGTNSFNYTIPGESAITFKW